MDGRTNIRFWGASTQKALKGNKYLWREALRDINRALETEKRIGAECHMGNIRFDKDKQAVVGDVQDPFLDLGEGVILRALSQGAAYLLEQQTQRFAAVPLIKKHQLEEMVAPAGGPLKLKMGIEDVRIEVSESELTLKVRFGFGQR